MIELKTKHADCQEQENENDGGQKSDTSNIVFDWTPYGVISFRCDFFNKINDIVFVLFLEGMAIIKVGPSDYPTSHVYRCLVIGVISPLHQTALLIICYQYQNQRNFYNTLTKWALSVMISIPGYHEPMPTEGGFNPLLPNQPRCRATSVTKAVICFRLLNILFIFVFHHVILHYFQFKKK